MANFNRPVVRADPNGSLPQQPTWAYLHQNGIKERADSKILTEFCLALYLVPISFSVAHTSMMGDLCPHVLEALHPYTG